MNNFSQLLILNDYIDRIILFKWVDIVDLCNGILDFLNNQGAKFSGFLFGLLIGLIVAVLFMRFALRLNTKHYKNQSIEHKEYIRELKFLVYDKLENLKVPPANKVWFERLKKFFYKEAKGKE